MSKKAMKMYSGEVSGGDETSERNHSAGNVWLKVRNAVVVIILVLWPRLYRSLARGVLGRKKARTKGIYRSWLVARAYMQGTANAPSTRLWRAISRCSNETASREVSDGKRRRKTDRDTRLGLLYLKNARHP